MAVGSSFTSSSDGGLARFCRRALLFVALQSAIFVVLATAYVRAQSESFLASTRDKHARAQAAQQPRMFFVGGSNVAFGLDCTQVRRRTEYQPVNLAVHAGAGMDFMLKEALDEVRANDVVVVSLEYAHLAGFMPQGKDLRALMNILLFRPQNVTYLSGRMLRTLFDNGFCVFQTVARSAADECRGVTQTFTPPYRRDSFNEYGDVVAHRGMDSESIDTTEVSMRKLSPARLAEAVERLNGFDTACRARGVFACYAYPPIPDVCLEEGGNAIAEVDRSFAQHLTMPVLNRPQDVAWPLEQFFDTCYHLTGAAATRRTDLILDSLTPALTRFAADAAGRSQFKLLPPGRSARQ